MFYRLKQLYNALFPKVQNNEYQWIDNLLTLNEQQLFKAQTLTEQRHALDVAYDIRKDKKLITDQFDEFTYSCLIKAALLHDCGKSIIRLHIWQRVFIVLIGYFPPYVNKLLSHNDMLNKTLIIYLRHPAWGKRLASQSGVCVEIQDLIENHHTPSTHVEKILFLADNRH